MPTTLLKRNKVHFIERYLEIQYQINLQLKFCKEFYAKMLHFYLRATTYFFEQVIQYVYNIKCSFLICLENWPMQKLKIFLCVSLFMSSFISIIKRKCESSPHINLMQLNTYLELDVRVSTLIILKRINGICLLTKVPYNKTKC